MGFYHSHYTTHRGDQTGAETGRGTNFVPLRASVLILDDLTPKSWRSPETLKIYPVNLAKFRPQIAQVWIRVDF